MPVWVWRVARCIVYYFNNERVQAGVHMWTYLIYQGETCPNRTVTTPYDRDHKPRGQTTYLTLSTQETCDCRWAVTEEETTMEHRW